MSRGFVLAIAGAAALLVLLVTGIFHLQRGDHLEPAGKILKVRSVAADDNDTVAVLDVRIKNDSDVTVVVRDLVITVSPKGGDELPGSVVSASGTKQVFEYYKELGELYNPPLVAQSSIPARRSADWAVAVRFHIPQSEFERRGSLALTVQDRSLLKFTISEKR